MFGAAFQITPVRVALGLLLAANCFVKGLPEGKQALAADAAIPPSQWVPSLALAPSGQEVALSVPEGMLFRPSRVVVQSLASATEGAASASPVKELPDAHTAMVWKVLFNPAGTHLASSDYTGQVKVWDLASGQVVKFNAGVWVRALAFSPDGKVLAVGTQRGKVHLVQAADGAELKVAEVQAGAIHDLAYAADGALYAVGSNGFVKRWAVPLEGEPLTFAGHSGTVWGLAIAPQGDVIATAGEDKTVRLWNAQGALQKTLEGASDWITDLAISPDGTTIYTCGMDQRVRVWSAALGLQDTLGPSGSSLWSLGLSSDGKHLLVGTRRQGVIQFGKTWKELGPLPVSPVVAASEAVAKSETPAASAEAGSQPPASATPNPAEATPPAADAPAAQASAQ